MIMSDSKLENFKRLAEYFIITGVFARGAANACCCSQGVTFSKSPSHKNTSITIVYHPNTSSSVQWQGFWDPTSVSHQSAIKALWKIVYRRWRGGFTLSTAWCWTQRLLAPSALTLLPLGRRFCQKKTGEMMLKGVEKNSQVLLPGCAASEMHAGHVECIEGWLLR